MIDLTTVNSNVQGQAISFNKSKRTTTFPPLPAKTVYTIRMI